MTYFSPYIDGAGLHIPTYNDTRDQMVQDAKNVFGQDIYLEIDSQDYQWIASVAEKIYDSFQLAQYVYNNRSPSTAIGVALDSLIKINGIKRAVAVFSTCLVTLQGVPNTQIINGVVSDINENSWDLPSLITIPEGESIEVTATCQIAGPIVANSGEITGIVTPTYGWNSVINNVASIPGMEQETDAQLRARQALSTAVPSQTILEGTKGAIAAVSGVTRFVVYENDTDTVDANGFPAHSITCVVEGGIDSEVASAIYLNKGIGAYTNGGVLVTITDSYGQTVNIRFYRPVYKDIEVVVNVKALPGYTSEITEQIKQNLTDYLGGLSIGEDLTISALWGSSLLAMNDLRSPLFSITSLTAAVQGQLQGTTDITMNH